MRVLGSAVLAMESILMGFALLIAKDQATLGQIWLGIALAVLLLMTSGMLRRKVGFLLGSMLQIFVIGYGYVISLMFYLGGLFAILWVAHFGKPDGPLGCLCRSPMSSLRGLESGGFIS